MSDNRSRYEMLDDIPFEELPKTPVHRIKESNEIPDSEKVRPVQAEKWCKPPNEKKTVENKVTSVKKQPNKRKSSPKIQASDISSLKTRIFENHGINISNDDPMLVMITIMDFYQTQSKQDIEELREQFNSAIAVFKKQSESQLSVASVRELNRLLREKKVSKFEYLKPIIISILFCIFGLTFAYFTYKPIQVGKSFMEIYPHLSNQAKKEINQHYNNLNR